MARIRLPDALTRYRIGCAGWAVPPDWRTASAQGASRLAHYAVGFNATEINSSFHRPHRASVYARWATEVPEDFRFSVKMPKTISHGARLQQCAGLLDTFMDQVEGLADKLGCLLLQTPPGFAADLPLAGTFFGQLRRRWPGPVAWEARHPGWSDAATNVLFSDWQITRVGADPARFAGAECSTGDPSLRYWRLHGSPRTYSSAYDADALRAFVGITRINTADVGEAWVIFDNTAHGHAYPNAREFRTLVD